MSCASVIVPMSPSKPWVRAKVPSVGSLRKSPKPGVNPAALTWAGRNGPARSTSDQPLRSPVSKPGFRTQPLTGGEPSVAVSVPKPKLVP